MKKVFLLNGTDCPNCLAKIEKRLESKLAFGGDGINDAPVLARDDVGVIIITVLNAMCILKK